MNRALSTTLETILAAVIAVALFVAAIYIASEYKRIQNAASLAEQVAPITQQLLKD